MEITNQVEVFLSRRSNQSVTAVALGTGLSESSVRRVLKDLIKSGKATSIRPRGWPTVYSLIPTQNEV